MKINEGVCFGGKSRRLLLFAAIVCPIAIAFCNLVFGPLNQDEGWYLLAAQNTAGGMVPYRDFVYTQGPVMPYVYAALSFLWSNFGVLGGRLLTMVFGLAAAALISVTAAKSVPSDIRFETGFTTWILTTCNPVFSYFTIIPKTYALTAVFLSAAFFSITVNRRFSPELSGIFIALATATRASMAAVAIAFGVFLLFRARTRRFHWLRFGLAGLITALLIYMPALTVCPERFLFCQTYHSGRAFPGIFQWLMLRAGFISRLCQSYPAHVTLAVLIACLCGCGVFRLRQLFSNEFFTLGLTAFSAVFILHLIVPFPYDDYQTPVMHIASGVLAAAAAAALENLPVKGKNAFCAAVSAITVIFAISAPICMSWVSIRQDRFWIEFKKIPDVIALRDVGQKVAENTPEDGFVLTQDAYIAVEAHRKVVPGLEMGPFSIFGGISSEKARKMNVHTPATLKETITSSDAPMALVSGYSFALECPSTNRLPEKDREMLLSALREKYTLSYTVPNFGQQHTTLEIYNRRQ